MRICCLIIVSVLLPITFGLQCYTGLRINQKKITKPLAGTTVIRGKNVGTNAKVRVVTLKQQWIDRKEKAESEKFEQFFPPFFSRTFLPKFYIGQLFGTEIFLKHVFGRILPQKTFMLMDKRQWSIMQRKNLRENIRMGCGNIMPIGLELKFF